MELMDLYEQIKNPIEDESVIRRLIQAEANTAHGWGGFYGQLTKTVEKDYVGKYSTDNYNKLYSKLFNKWKNSILNLTEEQVTELINKGSYKQDFLKLREFLKTIPDVTTEKEARDIFYGQYDDKDLAKAIEDYKWTAIGEDSGWIHIHSRYLTAKQDGKPNVEHRLYLNTEPLCTHQMALYFIEKCDEHNLPYYFKIDEYGNRDDTIVIYSSTDNLTKYIEILREIQKEHPAFVSEVKSPPVLTGKIDGWIGYGSEPELLQDGTRTSFNKLRAEIIGPIIVEKRNEWIEKNKHTLFDNEGRQVTVQEYITQKAIDNMFASMKRGLEWFVNKKPEKLAEEEQKRGYSLQDLNNPVFKDKVSNIIR